MTAGDYRASVIAGYRALADALERHPELQLPVDGVTLPLAFTFFSDGAREKMAAARRALPCAWSKGVTSGETTSYFDLNGRLGGLDIVLTAYRDTVCKRVVTGTEMRPVERVVTPAVTETVEQPVEVAEWVCGSLLAPEDAPALEGAA